MGRGAVGQHTGAKMEDHDNMVPTKRKKYYLHPKKSFKKPGELFMKTV